MVKWKNVFGNLIEKYLGDIDFSPSWNIQTETEYMERNETEEVHTMEKTIFEKIGSEFERQGDYLIPCLALPPEKEQPIGLFGRQHLDYLKQHRKVTYTNLLTSGKLNAYLADIGRQAQERFYRLIEGMKQAQGITERLKEENTLEWTGKMNNVRACAREIVNEEIIYA